MKTILFMILAATLTAYGQIPGYNVTMTPGDYQLLYTRDIFSDSTMPASFEYGGSFWNDAQIRFKGHSTRYYPKKSYRIKFSSSHLFQGLKSVDLNSMYTDKSQVREKLAWDLYADMRQMAPNASHGLLTINGESKGLCLFLDKIDKYFLQNRGRTVAPMYQANDTYTAGDFTVQPDSLLKLYYDKEIGDANDYSDLAHLIAVLNSAPEATFADTVRKYFDTASVLNWFAGNTLMMMGDSYVKNYFLYCDTSRSTGQWAIIPWDYDLSFGRTGDLGIPYPASLLNDGFAYTFPPLAGPSNVLKDRFMASPGLWEGFRRRVDSLLQTVFTEGHLYPRIDSLAALVEHAVALDPLKWGTIEDFYDHIEALKYYVTARRNYLLRTFVTPPSGEYDIATLPVSQTGVPYHFVTYDGRQIATLWFASMQGLDSIRIRAYPDSTPPGIPLEAGTRCVKRWITITPYPAGALFAAKLQWMYSDVSSLDREVGAGVQNERLLRCYNFDGGDWTPLPSRVNPFANIVTVDSISQAHCGAGKFFALRLSDTYTQKWFRQPTFYWQRWFDVVFMNSLTGLVAGEHGTVLVTRDGGGTWQTSSVGSALPLRSVCADSAGNIFTAGENGSLYRSSDTGKSWTGIPLGVTKNINGVFFQSPHDGWIYGERGLLLRSTDGGAVWLPWGPDSAKNIAGVAAQIPEVGVYFEDATYIESTDQGSTWTGGNVPGIPKLRRVKTAADRVWWVGDSGAVVSRAASRQYRSLGVPIPVTLRDLSVVNQTTLYVAGDGGRIFYTTDEGSHWYEQYTADSHDLYALTFTDTSHGYSFGNAGTILLTTSSGTLTGVKSRAPALPAAFVLRPNYPNPFNPATTIEYDLPRESRVVLTIFNVLGQALETLVSGNEPAGTKRVQWRGDHCASGVYFYRLEATSLRQPALRYTQVQKMLLVR